MRLPLMRLLTLSVVLASRLALSQYPPLGQLTIPAAASAHGVGGSFWRTDLWIGNQSDRSLTLHVYFDCRSGCSETRLFTHQVTLSPYEAKMLEDVLGTAFQLPETSGALRVAESCWHCPPPVPFFATSRTYTMGASGNGTYGTAVSAFSKAQETSRALFPGVASHGRDFSSGYRTNAGFTPASNGGYTVTFTLKDVTGQVLGVPLTLPGAGPLQVDDIFAAAGAGDVETRNAILETTSTKTGFPYAFVIDNTSGDSVFVQGFFTP